MTQCLLNRPLLLHPKGPPDTKRKFNPQGLIQRGARHPGMFHPRFLLPPTPKQMPNIIAIIPYAAGEVLKIQCNSCVHTKYQIRPASNLILNRSYPLYCMWYYIYCMRSWKLPWAVSESYILLFSCGISLLYGDDPATLGYEQIRMREHITMYLSSK